MDTRKHQPPDDDLDIMQQGRIGQRANRDQEWTPPRVRGDDKWEAGQRRKRNLDGWTSELIEEARKHVQETLEGAVPEGLFEWEVKVVRKNTGVQVSWDDPDTHDAKYSNKKAKVTVTIGGMTKVKCYPFISKNELLFDIEEPHNRRDNRTTWNPEFWTEERQYEDFHAIFANASERSGILLEWDVNKKSGALNFRDQRLDDKSVTQALWSAEADEDNRSNKRSARK